ncbi:hypothetical protein TrVE_jg2959 [Triparma verrucosa]|uniref:Uncharacterized protein n=1 Tax=Triparma verrucosa TaxID=1606542 RepID=A0A9W7FLA5_9STRA|nr:hypothetical protein TrVE_jg2959 [Triparma verrucosa]
MKNPSPPLTNSPPASAQLTFQESLRRSYENATRFLKSLPSTSPGPPTDSDPENLTQSAELHNAILPPTHAQSLPLPQSPSLPRSSSPLPSPPPAPPSTPVCNDIDSTTRRCLDLIHEANELDVQTTMLLNGCFTLEVASDVASYAQRK